MKACLPYICVTLTPPPPPHGQAEINFKHIVHLVLWNMWVKVRVWSMARVRKRQEALGLEQEKIDLKYTGYWKATNGS